MKSGDSIVLKVPGTEDRHGTYCNDLGFDNMCKVHLTHFDKKGKKKAYREPHWYLAHKEHVSLTGM